MKDEEKYIEERFGRKNPFAVPDHYFDDFATKLMQQLPEKENTTAHVVEMKPSWWHRYRVRVVSAAACVCLLAGGAGVFFHVSESRKGSAEVTAQSKTATPTSSYSVMDAMADYTMLDTGDMYAYMADAK